MMTLTAAAGFRFVNDPRCQCARAMGQTNKTIFSPECFYHPLPRFIDDEFDRDDDDRTAMGDGRWNAGWHR
jgi:hypothetical protein